MAIGKKYSTAMIPTKDAAEYYAKLARRAGYTARVKPSGNHYVVTVTKPRARRRQRQRVRRLKLFGALF